MTCMNTQMMHSRQSDEDAAESLQDAIAAKALALMQHGESCDPVDGFNVIEALGEATNTETIVLGIVLARREFDQAGILIDQVSREYWAKKANEMAEKELS